MGSLLTNLKFIYNFDNNAYPFFIIIGIILEILLIINFIIEYNLMKALCPCYGRFWWSTLLLNFSFPQK